MNDEIKPFKGDRGNREGRVVRGGVEGGGIYIDPFQFSIGDCSSVGNMSLDRPLLRRGSSHNISGTNRYGETENRQREQEREINEEERRDIISANRARELLKTLGLDLERHEEEQKTKETESKVSSVFNPNIYIHLTLPINCPLKIVPFSISPTLTQTPLIIPLDTNCHYFSSIKREKRKKRKSKL